MIFQPRILASGYSLEALSYAHAQKLAALHARMFSPSWSKMEFQNFLSDDRYICLGAFSGRWRVLGGFIILRHVADEAEVITVGVKPKARRKGIGKALLDLGAEILAHEGVRTLHLEVEEQNKDAVSLYKNYGFEITGVREGYYSGQGGNKPSNAYVMSLEINRVFA